MSVEKNNKPVFYLIAVLLPIVLLLLIELTLTAIGYGKSLPLFVKSQDFPGYLQPNPNIIERYFPSKELAPRVSPDTVYFPQRKGQDVFRIVIQGGSSAAGFPFGRFGSMQGMLEQRFKRTYPDKKIEVINTAMAAVNSYTLLDFVDEIVEIEPDAVFIYTGHNEYLGVLGAGSALAGKGGRSATLGFLWLKDLKLYQLLESLVQSLTPLPEQAQTTERTLMAKVAKGSSIPFESDLYYAGIEQFSGNLSDIISVYSENQIPVFLGTLASIEKQMPPFSTIAQVDWDAERSVIEQQALQGPAKSYLLGLQALDSGNTEQALEQFQSARDLDELRFRAPSAFNQIIKSLAKENGVTLVDVESAIRADSKDGIIGLEHMLEHVHPTLRGYFLLSESFYQSLVKSGLLGKEQFGYGVGSAWQDVPVNNLDKMWAELKILQLKSDYPFTREPKTLAPPEIKTKEQQLLLERMQGANWLDLQLQLQQHYLQTNNFKEAGRVAGVVSDAMVNSSAHANTAASIYRAMQDIPMARYYQARALALEPNNPQYLMNQAQHEFMLGQLQQSLTLLEKAEPLLDNPIKARFFIDKVKATLQEQGGSRG